MHDANDIDIALTVFGLLVAFGSAGLARFALARLDRDERAEIERVDRDFAARLPSMGRPRPRPAGKY